MGEVVSNNKRITVYGFLKKQEVTCNLGHRHTQSLYTRKFLYPTGDMYLMNNGYYSKSMPVFRDGQNRVYWKHEEIDYFNNISYRRQTKEGPNYFVPRLPVGGVVVGEC